jgi:hypothetical protein
LDAVVCGVWVNMHVMEPIAGMVGSLVFCFGMGSAG